MTSGIINTEPAFHLPGTIVSILGSFTKRKKTGQVIINFQAGRILAADTREHITADAAVCRKCDTVRSSNDKQWIVRGGAAYCPECA
jgi:hypothetical protein